MSELVIKIMLLYHFLHNVLILFRRWPHIIPSRRTFLDSMSLAQQSRLIHRTNEVSLRTINIKTVSNFP